MRFGAQTVRVRPRTLTAAVRRRQAPGLPLPNASAIHRASLHHFWNHTISTNRPPAARVHYLTHPTAAPTDAASLFRQADDLLTQGDPGSGRGAALRFKVGDVAMVFKDYHRGGLPARFVRATYLGRQLERTRMWREFRLLVRLAELGLPVPTPIAARCIWCSPVTYRGDLITRELPDTETLSRCLTSRCLSPQTWANLGAVIRRFHDKGVHHADLNTHNVLLDGSARFHLLDFDKGSIRAHAESWKQSTLRRLRRSLERVTGGAGKSAAFREADWSALLEAYHAHGADSASGAGGGDQRREGITFRSALGS